jgi:hypothetical protein
MDQEREQERRTYRLCRLGFGLLALTLAVACFLQLVELSPLFLGRRGFFGLRGSAVGWWLAVVLTWGLLPGAYLLWGRWSEAGWQRRAGLLVLMGMVDIVLWLIRFGEALGLRTGDFGHEWLRDSLGAALGWAELALTAGLACEMLVHLGVAAAAETGKATRSLAATGAVVWMLWFCQVTDWGVWPLAERKPFPRESLLVYMGWTMIWTITLLQVTALTVAATRQCTRVLAQMDAEDAENDPLRPPSERDDGGLLRVDDLWDDGTASRSKGGRG